MPSFSLASFGAMLIEASAKTELDSAVLGAACQMLWQEARDLIGHEQPEWPALSSATLAHKLNGNTPLLETGAMRASIGFNHDGREGFVGSNDPLLRFHEFGSDKAGAAWGSPNPPRPVLGLAIVRKEDEIKAMVGRAAAAYVMGLGYGSEMAEVLRLIRELGRLTHEIATGVDETLSSPDDKRAR